MQQIVGVTHNLHRRSGSVLPPPEDEPFTYSSASAEEPTVESDEKVCTLYIPCEIYLFC